MTPLAVDILLNWLWQGLVVAGAAAVALRVSPRAVPRSRLLVCWAALLLIAALPLLGAAPLALAGSGLGVLDGDDQLRLPLAVDGWASLHASLVLTALWGLWATVCGSRLALAAIRVRRALSVARPLPATRERQLRHWSQVSSGGRPTRIVISDRVHGAAVLGVGRPVIAIAPVLLDHLDDAELDAVVLHEWLHIQRRDDVGNCVQLLAGATVGWHPAMAWARRQLDAEREMACDAGAAAILGSARRYAACLVRLAALPIGPRSPLPVPGVIGSSAIGRRIERILSPRPALAGWRADVNAALALVWLGAVAGCAGGNQLIAGAAADSLAPHESTGLHAVGGGSTGHTAALSVPARPVSVELGIQPARVMRRPRSSRHSDVPATRTVSSVEPDIRPEIADGPPPATMTPAVPGVSVEPVRMRGFPKGLVIGVDVPAASAKQSADAVEPRGLRWGAAAHAGLVAGRESRKAAQATAGLFTKFGRRVAAGR